MNNKYITLFKYEFKKLYWLIGAMILFLILYGTAHNNNVASDVSQMISFSSNFYICLKIMDIDFYFIFIAFVFAMVYLQFSDGFNKLWHSLPFKNKDVIYVKLATGFITLFLFFTVVFIIMLSVYFKYADIYRDTLTVLNINPGFINPLFILMAVGCVFAVYVAIYFLTVLFQYIIGNCISGIVLSALFIHIPVLILTSTNFNISEYQKYLFLIFPDFYDSTNSIYYIEYTNYTLELLSSYIDFGILNKFTLWVFIYYSLGGAIILLILSKVSTSSKWIEQSNPFSKKWTAYFFKTVFVIAFAMVGATPLYESLYAKIIISAVFAVIGYVVSSIIIKQQGVSK